MAAGEPRARRECVGDFISQPQWRPLVLLSCFEGDVNENLDNLLNMTVTPENAEEVARETASLTSNADDIGPSALMTIAGILEKLVAANNTSPAVASQIVTIVNNVLQIDRDATFEEAASSNSPSRIVAALESFVSALHSNGVGNLTEVQSSLAVVALSIPRGSLSNGFGFGSSLPISGADSLTGDRISVFMDKDAQLEAEASIFLPAEILYEVSEGGSDQVPLSFFLYQSSSLFQSPTLHDAARPEEGFRREVGSRVIAATVEGVKIENLAMPVSSVFSLVNVTGENETVHGAQCVFWDFSLNDGAGDWSTEGCRNESVSDGVVRCLCDHLTSFAVIVDIYGQQENVFLSVISKLGCAVSVVALIITLVTYLYSKKLRSKQPQQIQISLCFALLALYLVFLVGIEAISPRAGCIVVAVLIHYSTLASIAWMAVEATNMYLLFVRVLNARVSRFVLKASIAAWGLPLVIVIIILAADYSQYDSPNYCFLKPGNAIYFGQLLPIGLVLLFNFVVFTLVMRKLTCARKTISSSSDRSGRQETIRRLQNALAISVLLGLTWVFGLLSVFQAANFAFQVLFTVCNSLQGLMIFILFCARQKEVRQVWWEMLPCKKPAVRKGEVSGTGLESTTRGAISLSSKVTKETNLSEMSQAQS
ncbi:adhesion G-protein coupled receptor G6-like isoform X2 [Acanthaster planci]|uniref:Adhesion G-protein coupled receptor G6-like isoform X2 n=1 Tax=Acanthaster planci TaxID=133434 RepID=A0A8B7YZP7_ACAPL|nr:adhesion G-protein coupled receptor G6-like isoform X2 [Acanthaster planci]